MLHHLRLNCSINVLGANSMNLLFCICNTSDDSLIHMKTLVPLIKDQFSMAPSHPIFSEIEVNFAVLRVPNMFAETVLLHGDDGGDCYNEGCSQEEAGVGTPMIE